jgi:hypothetical protein
MRRASLACCGVLLATAAYAPPAPTAPARHEPVPVAAVTVSECLVYAYLRDTVVTRQRMRRTPNSCTTGEARKRDV